MKGFLIGPDNEKFEANIVRYFQNVNDKYLIYTKGEKDANGYELLYVTKVINDNGIKVGETITDENEWALIKNFLKQTVNENKENKPLSIKDCNPIEINDLKINNQRPFKLQETVVELFGKNKASFEIVQKMLDAQNTVSVPVAPEFSEFVTSNDEVTNDEAVTSNEEITPNEPINEEQNIEVKMEPAANDKTSMQVTEELDYAELYKTEQSRNKELEDEIQSLTIDNANMKKMIDQIKELIG